jgi:hypothetical protein
LASRSIRKISKVLDAREKLKGMTARGKRTFPKGTTRVIASPRALGNQEPPERKWMSARAVKPKLKLIQVPLRRELLEYR